MLHHVTNKEFCAKIEQAIGPDEDLTIVKRCKQQWFGHVPHRLGLATTLLAKYNERGKKTGKEVGIQHQGVDRLEGHQVPEGSG